MALARLHRAGELTAVWIPDVAHEALRDLVCARADAVAALRRCRQQLGGFLLRHGRVFSGRTAWGGVHRRWLSMQAFAHVAQQIPCRALVVRMRHLLGGFDHHHRFG